MSPIERLKVRERVIDFIFDAGLMADDYFIEALTSLVVGELRRLLDERREWLKTEHAQPN